MYFFLALFLFQLLAGNISCPRHEQTVMVDTGLESQ